MNNKIDINFIGEKQTELYSTWQITKIVDTIGDFNYKKLLIKEIYSHKNIKNILVLDKSINVSLKYVKEKGHIFSLDSESILEIYHKGSPFPLYVNKEYALMYELFEFFRVFVNKYNNYYNDNIKNEIKGELLFSLYKELISSFEIDKVINNFIIKFEELKIRPSDYKNLIKVNTVLDRYALYQKLDSKEQKKAEYDEVKKYIKNFEYYFETLNRPLVYIVDKNDNYQLLNSELINNKKFIHENEYFLETRLIKQNSPLLITLGVSALMTPTFLNLGIELLKAQQEKNENQDEYNAKLEELKNLREETSVEESVNFENADIANIEETIENKAVRYLEDYNISFDIDLEEE